MNRVSVMGLVLDRFLAEVEADWTVMVTIAVLAGGTTTITSLLFPCQQS